MQALSSATRTQNLSLMENETFDVLVIGGGVTGAGVAFDATTRGYRVALVEKNDFASGTSSKSTKLVHGGIRYLPNFDFALVHEALVERGLLLQNAPFLVQPLPFILPIYRGDRHPVGIPFTTPGGIGLGQLLNTGLWLYDLMAGKQNSHKYQHLSREDVLRLAPLLISEGLKEGFVYYDAQTNDARLTITLIRSAASYGATIANYAEVTSFVTGGGRLSAARVRDSLNKQEFTIHARHIVNATGVFAESVEALASTNPQIQVEPSKGVHLVFSREAIGLDHHALVLPETDDKRILFIVPWGSRVLFGTTDTGSGDLDHPAATPQDIRYLLGHLNRYLARTLTTEDIISTYAGYRPLVKSRSGEYSNARLSRTHTILQSPTGLVSIVGGKLTTYRRMAQDTVDVLDRRDNRKPRHPTQNLPLQGSVGWLTAQQDIEQKGAALGLSSDTLKHLDRSYGAQAQVILALIREDSTLAERLVDDLPYIQAEVIYACREEMAMTPYDVLARRTAITLEDRQRGLGVVEKVAALMAKELAWTLPQQKHYIDAYRASIEEQMAIEVRA
jgi:glycerol-3-phosphate dehydrogenase